MIFKRLVKLANQLDAKGQYKLADKMEKSANALSLAGGGLLEGVKKLAPNMLKEISEVAPQQAMSVIDRLAANLKRYYPNMTQEQILQELKLMNPGRLNEATKTPKIPFNLPISKALQDFYQQPYRLQTPNLWQNTPGSVKALGLGGLGAAALMWPRGPQSTGYNNPTSPKSYNQFDQTQIAGYDLRTGKPWYKGQPAPKS
jgi:hypothetical protein